METRRISKTVKMWKKFVEGARASEQATEHDKRCADVVERAMAAAAANCRCTIDELPWNLPGQALAIDVPVA